MLKTRRNLSRRIIFRVLSDIFRLVKPVDFLFLSFHKIRGKINPPPIFIIGAPRTGSTLLYQIITHYYNVNYISNFSALFYHSLFLGMIIDDFFLGNKVHNSFKSSHGLTYRFKGPNECGQFWYRWFPKDRHFVGSDEFTKKELLGIRKTISAIVDSIPNPLVFKNLNNGQRLQVIQKILPEALFIVCKRNPIFTVQSILKSRIYFHGNKNTWLSVMPKNKNELELLDYPEQIVKQVFYLEKQIKEDLILFPESQSIIIEYEKFCSRTEKELERLEQFFHQNRIDIKKRKNVCIPDCKLSNNIKVSKQDFKLLKKEVGKLDWEKYAEPLL